MQNDEIEQQFQLLLPRLKNHGVSERYSHTVLRAAFTRIVRIFSDFEIRILPEIAILTISDGTKSIPIDILGEVLPAIAFAIEYFTEIPDHLLKKLRNRTQTADTLFELYCMAIIGQHHKIDYEPTLLGGKVPDFRIRSKIEVFVECKAQRFMEADAHQTFQKFGSELLSSIEKVNVVTAARQSNFRTEVRLSRTPNSKQIQELSNILSVATLEQLIQGITVASIFKVGAVPRSQGLLKGHFQHMAHVTVSTEPTALTHENARVLVYSWPNIEKQIARTQRRLLAEARVQLRGIPAGTYGMICVQTLPNAQFRRDVHKLVEQQQFQHIPIIWVNPKMKNSRVIFRDDAGDLMHMIFDPILAA